MFYHNMLECGLNEVELKGICTNIPLQKKILQDEKFRGGDYDTGFLQEFLDRIDRDALIQEIEDVADIKIAKIGLDELKIDGSNEIKVLSPSTSIYYATPTPTEPDFVKVGDRIDVDKTICLLEAMKNFRPITLEQFNTEDNVLYDPNKKYKVVRMNQSSGQTVNKGDLLFVIKPV